MVREITFFVPGIPATQGSKRGFLAKSGKVIVKESCRGNRDWRGDVKRFAVEACPRSPLTGAVLLEVGFRLPRPKGHYGARGIRPSAPRYPVTKPDLTKLLRALEDALKGLAWKDDSQVVAQRISKDYTDETPGAHVRITEIK